MSESSLYPTALDTTNLYEVVARLSTTLTADITAATTTIPLASTTGFPTTGYIVIDNETIKYISVSVGSVDATGGRGHAGTAASHTNTTQVLVAVTAAVFNKLRAGMIAVQTKVGIDASGTTTTHDYKLSGVTGSGKAVNNAYAETIAGVKTFSSLPVLPASVILTTPVIGSSISGTAIATGAEVTTGTDNTKIVTPKAVGDAVVNTRLKSKVITATRDMAAASGDVAYTGVGFTPTSVSVVAGIIGTAAFAVGFADSTTTGAVVYTSAADVIGVGNSFFIIQIAAGYQIAIIKSFDADGLTLTYSKGSTPTGTIELKFLCFR